MNPTTVVAENSGIQPAKVLDSAKARTTGGREGGASRTSDGWLDAKLSVPDTLGNGNPEELFAVGWSACFASAIKIVAAQMKVKVPSDLALISEVDLRTGEDGYFLQARLNVSLPGLDRQVAQSILEGAHLITDKAPAVQDAAKLSVNFALEHEQPLPIALAHLSYMTVDERCRAFGIND